jgi:hypothetical protein
VRRGGARRDLPAEPAGGPVRIPRGMLGRTRGASLLPRKARGEGGKASPEIRRRYRAPTLPGRPAREPMAGWVKGRGEGRAWVTRPGPCARRDGNPRQGTGLPGPGWSRVVSFIMIPYILSQSTSIAALASRDGASPPGSDMPGANPPPAGASARSRNSRTPGRPPATFGATPGHPRGQTAARDRPRDPDSGKSPPPVPMNPLPTEASSTHAGGGSRHGARRPAGQSSPTSRPYPLTSICR